MLTLRYAVTVFLVLLLLGCSTTPAPVIDRTPAAKPGTASQSKPAIQVSSKPLNGKNGQDWRPDTHIVKKGDTLFSIGLEYGYDYKDIARINNIETPYIIRIGQTLQLAALKEKPGLTEAKPEKMPENGVITYPISDDGSTISTKPTTPANPSAVAVLNTPKALREPYSEAALKASAPVPTSVAKATPDNKPVTEENDAKPQSKTTPPPESKSSGEMAGTLNWIWPTKGKVISGFNDGGNKGIDITGTKGQPIVAAASGKVIYSGSDLRGYGKLVIVKHNNTYLSVYANNSNILVKEGQQVSAGQKIAEMGDTDSNIVKLHFEIRQQGKSVDPAKFLASN